jgi:hypothetical protein
MFQLVNLTTGEFLTRKNGHTFTLDDGRKASRAARLLTKPGGVKYQPRKVAPVVDLSWRQREQDRFNSGEYLPLCADLAFHAKLAKPLHYAHTAKRKPTLIAYTKDDERGAADKQSVMTIEAYIELIAQEHWSTQLKTALAKRQLEYATAAYKPFLLATDADDIVSVYTNYDEDSESVSKSCMRFEEDDSTWSKVDGKRYHPCRVYAAGDLAVAYLTNDDGYTVARALVWPERKLFSRVYDGSGRLTPLLKHAGYTPSYYHDSSNTSFRGAKLLKIITDDDKIVAPYLDEVGYVDILDDGLVIGGQYPARSTDGVLERDNITSDHDWICEHCEEGFSEGDYSYEVYTRGNQTRSQTWCEHCRMDSAFYCEGTTEYYSDAHVECRTIDNMSYCGAYADEHAQYCDLNEEYTFEETEEVIIKVDDDGEEHTESWSEGAREEYAYLGWDSRWYHKDIECVTVISERYLPLTRSRTTRSPDGVYPYYTSFVEIAWYYDRKQKIPQYMIDNGSARVVEADGVSYLSGYRDYYPVWRPRLDVGPLVNIMEEPYYVAA